MKRIGNPNLKNFGFKFFSCNKNQNIYRKRKCSKPRNLNKYNEKTSHFYACQNSNKIKGFHFLKGWGIYIKIKTLYIKNYFS